MPKPPTKVRARNMRSVRSRAAPARRRRALTGTRFRGGSVSGRRNAIIARLTRPAAPRTPKIARHSATAMTAEPARGASIGETEMTSMIIAIIRVASCPVCMSRMIARGTTMTAAAPRAWTNRQATSVSMPPAKKHPAEPRR